MIIESAVPYAVIGLVFHATYAQHSNARHAVLPVLSQVMVRPASFDSHFIRHSRLDFQCINPELLILRVAQRRSLAELATKTTVVVQRTPFMQLIDSRPDVLPTTPIVLAPRS